MTDENTSDVQQVPDPYVEPFHQNGEIMRRIPINDQKTADLDTFALGNRHQQPDPSIRTIEHHDVHVFWLNEDQDTLYTTDETSMLQDGTFMCMPGLALQEGQTVIINDSADFKFFDKVSETINYYRKLNQDRPAAIAWTIPPDCPMGDELVANCYLPWDIGTLSRDPSLLNSDKWPTDQTLHPYCVMTLGLGEEWLKQFTYRALTFYSSLGKIQVVTDPTTGMITITEMPDENRRQSICGGESQVSLPAPSAESTL